MSLNEQAHQSIVSNKSREESGLRYEWLSSSDLHYIGELDRSEHIGVEYVVPAKVQLSADFISA